MEPPQRGRGTSLLTRREQDILSLLVSGVDLQSAALRLGITVNTARGFFLIGFAVLILVRGLMVIPR